MKILKYLNSLIVNISLESQRAQYFSSTDNVVGIHGWRYIVPYLFGCSSTIACRILGTFCSIYMVCSYLNLLRTVLGYCITCGEDRISLLLVAVAFYVIVWFILGLLWCYYGFWCSYCMISFNKIFCLPVSMVSLIILFLKLVSFVLFCSTILKV